MAHSRTHRRRRRYSTEQGVALLAVAVATGLTGVMVAEFSTKTNVDMVASYNAKDDMKLHFLARSGMNLSQLIMRVQTEILDKPNIRQIMGDLQLADYSGMFMGAFGGSQEEIEGVASMLGGFAARDMKGLGVPQGKFDVQITTEDNRINLNCANGGDTARSNLHAQLVNLFFPRGYDPVFQNEDADGWRRDRQTQAAAIVDYIDNNSTRYDPEQPRGTGPEDYGYEGLRDKYLAKNTYLDSVGELRQIRGVDDRFWQLFGQAFTVYGGCKLNMNAVENPLLIANVIFVATKVDARNTPVYNELNILTLARLVVAVRGLGYSFTADNEQNSLRLFSEFVQNPKQKLEEFFMNPMAGGAGNTPQIPQDMQPLLQTVQEGLELDPQLLSTVATAGPRRTYRVEAFAEIGEDDAPYKLTKRIVGVWDTKAPPPQNTRSPGGQDVSGRQGFGAWVYWRED